MFEHFEWHFSLYYIVSNFDDSAEKEDVFNFVCENEKELLKAIENEDYSEFENQSMIKNINPDETAVYFYCGGAGFGPSTFYVGFFYTPDNDMFAVWCAPSPSDPLAPSETDLSTGVRRR